MRTTIEAMLSKQEWEDAGNDPAGPEAGRLAAIAHLAKEEDAPASMRIVRGTDVWCDGETMHATVEVECDDEAELDEWAENSHSFTTP